MPQTEGQLLQYFVFLLAVSLMLGAWVCFYFGYHYFRRYQLNVVERLRLDAAVKEAELRALRAQVNPHFFFNSLNTLRALIPRELERPREAVTLLADLLRASLTVGQHRVVTLAEELETVKNYLALEQLRFETRLRVRLHAAPSALGLRLPPFVLQTLVENAIKYGVAPFEDGGDMEILCDDRDGLLALTIRNRGILAHGSASIGLGLANARSRLLLVCGPSAKLTVAQEGEQVVALVIAPQTQLFNLSHENSHHR
jgi:LytS/YehU family sensor histidine kinase